MDLARGLDTLLVAAVVAALAPVVVALLPGRRIPHELDPNLFLYRRDLPAVQRAQMMLLTATALPVLVFPTAAVAIERRRRPGSAHLPRFPPLPP